MINNDPPSKLDSPSLCYSEEADEEENNTWSSISSGCNSYNSSNSVVTMSVDPAHTTSNIPEITLSASFDEAARVNARTSNYVYIRSQEYSWIPARLISTSDDATNATVNVPQYKDEQSIQSDGGRSAKRSSQQIVKLDDYPNRALLLQNVDEKGQLIQVEDMVDLPFLHEVREINTQAQRENVWLRVRFWS